MLCHLLKEATPCAVKANTPRPQLLVAHSVFLGAALGPREQPHPKFHLPGCGWWQMANVGPQGPIPGRNLGSERPPSTDLYRIAGASSTLPSRALLFSQVSGECAPRSLLPQPSISKSVPGTLSFRSSDIPFFLRHLSTLECKLHDSRDFVLLTVL